MYVCMYVANENATDSISSYYHATFCLNDGCIAADTFPTVLFYDTFLCIIVTQ